MKLHFRKHGTGDPLLVLHGVFGSADNWQTVGKELAEKNTVYLVDQRNHGLSPHDSAMDYMAMSDDLKELCESEPIKECTVLGHSMGGKSAMYFACRFPDLVRQLVVVDIAPKYYLPHHQSIFEAFRRVNLEAITSRKDADEQVASVIREFGVRQFILKNLQRTSEGFSWKLNLNTIEQHIEDLGQGLPTEYRFEKRTLFVRGIRSDYIKEEDRAVIEDHFPLASLIDIDAGHWVHAEKPRELMDALNTFLS